MRMTLLAAGAAMALATLAGGMALAQTADRPDRAGRADSDGDGRISRTEFVEGRVGRLTAIDANRDGLVSAEERHSGMETRRNQRVSARFETLDKDGNGALSREEFTVGRERNADRSHHDRRDARRGHRGPGHGRGDHPVARAPMAIAEVRARAGAMFDRIDTNRDGVVTAEEREVGRERLRDHRNTRRAVGQPSPSATASE